MLRLYWCRTADGDRDYWVVAASWKVAAEFFAHDNGYELDEVTTVIDFGAVPGSPGGWLGRIFRPEGLVRKLMCSRAQTANRQRKRVPS